ncbi:hypothetical protein [Sphingobium abikonense]|uniref:hypothetical protein n=1 Tax=Sphingobium abikonense TaxID=86193 RepID=UPI00078681DF|nr:hypothetical protein [Sphingobium abikonense]
MTQFELLEFASAARPVPVLQADRDEFCRALMLQGYSPRRALDLAQSLDDNDGALQMLARHRVNATPPSRYHWHGEKGDA